jgi:hypothetical protein
MQFFRLVAFMLCFLEFTGSYIQTKSGDEKYHGKDRKLEKG